MTRFVRNPDGAVHSVPDDFELPNHEWSDASEADASPQLLGEPDPQVQAQELHDLASQPVEETPSSGDVGDVVEVPNPPVPIVDSPTPAPAAQTAPEVTE